MERVESLRTENKFKKTEIGKIPVDWETLNLENITEEIYRYPTYYNIEYQKEGIPEVRGELIRPNGKLETNLSRYRFISYKTALKFPRTYLKEGDFVISVRGTLGKVAIIPKFLDGANITANLIRMSTNRNKIYPLFFLQILISERFQENLNNISSRTTIKTIKAPELKRLKFAIPPLPEQKKIAEILLSVDEAIDKKQEIIEKTKMLKKGLMQELLTHGIGHKKFKKTEIGEIPVDWKVVKLGEVTRIIMGQSPPSDSYFEFVNGVPFFQGNAEFGAKFPKILKWCNSPRKLAETGDILVSVRAPVGDVNISPIECCIGRGLAALRGTKIHNDYLYFVMNYFKNILVNIGQGSTFEAINKRDIFELKIPFPTISEQKKIAEILTSVDEEIEKEMAQKEGIKNIKKGLMQVLLTGKIRVKI